MAVKKSLLITLDRERHLRFDFNAFCLVEEVAGADCMSSEFWDPITPTKLRALFYGGLKWEDPKLTVDQVGEIIQEALLADRMGELIEAALAAYQMAYPETKTEGDPANSA